MEGPVKEQWKELCEQAIVEKDPQKLLAVVAEINRLLEEKQNRLKANEPPADDGVTPENIEK